MYIIIGLKSRNIRRWEYIAVCVCVRRNVVVGGWGVVESTAYPSHIRRSDRSLKTLCSTVACCAYIINYNIYIYIRYICRCSGYIMLLYKYIINLNNFFLQRRIILHDLLYRTPETYHRRRHIIVFVEGRACVRHARRRYFRQSYRNAYTVYGII